MKITGSGREGLPKYSLEQMAFPLPPFSEQQRIVMRNEKLFALIDQIEHSKSDLQTIIKKPRTRFLILPFTENLCRKTQTMNLLSLLKRINPTLHSFVITGIIRSCLMDGLLHPMQVLCSLVDGDKQKE